MLLRRAVDVREPAAVALLVGRRVHALPVAREDGVVVRDLLAAARVARRELGPLAGLHVEQPQVALVDRNVLADEQRVTLRRPVGRPPPAALPSRAAPVGGLVG